MLLIQGKSTLPKGNAKAYARRRNAKRLDQVDQFIDETYLVGPKYGLDPGAVVAGAFTESGDFTNEDWNQRLNPVGLGHEDDNNQKITFATGRHAARAYIVHLLVYVRPTILHRVPNEYLVLDPRLAHPFWAGYAGKAKSFDGLAGKYATDPNYGTAVEARWRLLVAASVTPQPTPEKPGDAALPVGIVRHESANWHERTYGQQPVAMVYHITDDMIFDRVRSWFQNPVSKASAHFVIDRDGTIHQFVSTTRASWTNGDFENPRQDFPWLTEAIAASWPNGPRNLNDFTISIEHVGTPSQPPTEAQYQSSIAISMYCRDRYKLKVDRAHFLRHGDINSVDRSYCPGPNFDLARIIRACGGTV